MSTNLSQENRHLHISTPFGDDKVHLEYFAGGESFSELFEYEIDLILDVFEKDDSLSAAEIIGMLHSGVYVYTLVSTFSHRELMNYLLNHELSKLKKKYLRAHARFISIQKKNSCFKKFN